MATEAVQIFQSDPHVGELKLWRPPEQVLVEAQAAAAALQRIIATKPKKVMFNGEQYLEYEDWQTLAHFYGYVPKVESTEFVEFGDVQGFKASAVLISEHTGLTVSRAESMCLDDEENWGPRPKYEWRDVLDAQNNKRFENGKAVREKVQVGLVDTPLFQLLSMAETRACAKVCRNKLAWVAVLAGYKPTPAEEMNKNVPGADPAEPVPAPLPIELKRKEPQSQASAQAAAPKPPLTPQYAEPAPAARPPIQSPRPPQARVISEAQARRFYAIWKQGGRTLDQVKEYLKNRCGVDSDRDMPASFYDAACHWAETGKEF